MSVSSYLEAVLTVYGWDVYYIFYLLFASIGLFLYPLLRILHDVYISYLSGNEYSGTNYLRQLLTSMTIAMIIFFIALVPSMSIDLKETTVKSVCAEKDDVAERAGDYFNNINTKVPIMPYLVMSIAQGINSVIYKSAPCAVQVAEARKAVMSVNLSEADNPDKLNAEFNRFVGECHQKAKDHLNQIMDNKYGDLAGNAFTLGLDNMVDDLSAQTGINDEKQLKAYLLTNYDSSLIKNLLYDSNSILNSFTETKTIAPMIASGPVEGIKGYEQGSQQQGDATPPTCNEWWSGRNGLRYRLVSSMEESVAVNIANNLGIEECQNDMGSLRIGQYMSDTRKKSCLKRITDDLYNGNSDKLVTEMFRSIQGGAATDRIISGTDSAKLAGLTALGLGSSALALATGKDVSLGIVNQVTGFYTTIFLIKLILTIALPLVLMAIYMLWGFYMVIGEFRPMVMIRGLSLIAVIIIIPGFWAIIDHLDEALYPMMNADDGWFASLFGDLDSRLLFDAVISLFQIMIVFIIFFIFSLAGGADASSAVKSDQNLGQTTSKSMGTSIGGSVGRNVSKGMTKLSGGLKGGISKLKGK